MSRLLVCIDSAVIEFKQHVISNILANTCLVSDAAYIKTEKISNAAKAKEDMNPNQIAF